MGRTVRMRRHKLRPVPPSTPVTVGEPEEDEDGPEWRYPGVEFLSSRAYRIARRANLALADLEDVEGSGDDGELSAADVREIVDGLGG